MDSICEVVDSCVESVSEDAYVSWAERLKKLALKGEPRATFKHRWATAKKPAKFLSSAITALQTLLDQQPLRKPPSKAHQPSPWSRKWIARISFSSQDYASTERMAARTFEPASYEEMAGLLEGSDGASAPGFFLVPWHDDAEAEEKVKKDKEEAEKKKK